MAKHIEVVVIHGSHKHHDGLDDKGKPLNAPVVKKVGDTVTMSHAELKSLDPLFSLKKGIGERFATPEAAKKLDLKRQLEEELDSDGSEGDEEPADEPDEAPAAPTPPAAPAAKPKSKKGKG